MATFQDTSTIVPPVVIGDSSFEAVNVGTGSFSDFLYAPSGTAWGFTGGAGVAGDNSGFTSGNPNAPDGTQVGLLQGTGSFNQSILFSSGTYQLTFVAAQRGNWNQGGQTFQVSVDGNVVGTITPANTTYGSYHTDSFTVAAGAHTISFAGLNPLGGDNTAFVDQVSAVRLGANVGDASFETPNVGSNTFAAFQYDPSGTAWTFANGGGIAGNNSGFTSSNPGAPDGTQVGFLQGAGSSFSQAVNFDAGTYTFNFQAAQRGNWQPDGAQSIQVLLDGNVLGTFQPADTNYAAFQTDSFTVAAGSHTLTFQGLTNGDSTAFVDAVAVQPVDAAPPATAAITWGDGHSSSGTIVYDTASATFTVLGSHTYVTPNTYPITVAINHGNDTATANSTATIADAPLAVMGFSLTADNGGDVGGPVGCFTDADPNAALPGNYTASITWGDGSTSSGTVSLATPIADGSFETPNVGTAMFAYAPTGSPWTFTGGAGVAGDNSGFTSGNPTAPDGAQVGFLQGTGSFSQSVVLPAGSFTLGFQAAQRGNWNQGGQTFQVSVDGTAVGTFTPTSSTYAAFTTASFTVTAGTHTITFTGLNPNGGDNTAFVDQVQLTQPVFQVTSSHNYANGTSSAPVVTITDIGGGNASSAFTVNNLPLAISFSVSNLTAGNAHSAVVEVLDSGVSNTLTGMIHWGDGTVDSLAGGHIVFRSHVYWTAGTYTITVTTQDNQGATATASATATVAAPQFGPFVSPYPVAVGADSNGYFAVSGTNAGGTIGVFAPDGTPLRQLRLGAGHNPQDITAGPNGEHAVYFLEDSSYGGRSEIGRFDLETFALRYYPLAPSAQLYGGAIIAGPDGDLYFTDANAIGRLDPATGVITDIPGTAGAVGLIIGPDGALWYGNAADDGIGKLDLTTGTVTSIAAGIGIPSRLASGPDGYMYVWFTQPNAQDLNTVIYRVSATGDATAFLPIYLVRPGFGFGTQGIAVGPDGNIWTTLPAFNGFGTLTRITPDGVVTTYNNGDFAPQSLALSPDGTSFYYLGDINGAGVGTFTLDQFLDLQPVANQYNAEGDGVSLQLLTDSGTGPEVFSASNLPNGLTLDSQTGLISGTISAGDTAASPYSVIVSVSDGETMVTQNLTWTVGLTPPLHMDSLPDQVNVEHDTVVVSVAAYGGTAPLVYSATGLPSGVTIDPNTGLVSGAPGLGAAEVNGGLYVVTVSATDGTSTTSQSFTWQVTDLPLLLANPGDQANAEHDSISLPLFADGGMDHPGAAYVYTASGLPSGLSINPQTGEIDGQIGLDAAEVNGGVYHLTVAVSDGTATVSQSFTWTVTDLPLSLYIWSGLTDDQGNASFNYTEGDTADVTMTADGGLDSPGAAYVYSITALPPGLTLDAQTGVISGQISYNAADGPEGGTFLATASVTDGINTVSQDITWKITDLNRIVQPLDQGNFEGDTVSLPLALQPDVESGMSWSATDLPDGLSIDPSTGNISGTVSFNAADLDIHSRVGVYHPTITVTAPDGSTDSMQFTWSVQDTPLLYRPDDQLNKLGDIVSLQLETVPHPGLDLTFGATTLPDGLSLDPSTGLITGQLTSSVPVQSAAVYVLGDGVGDSVQFTWNVVEDQVYPVVYFAVNNTLRPEDDFAYVDPNAPQQQAVPVTITLFNPEPGTHVVQVTAYENAVNDPDPPPATLDQSTFALSDGQSATFHVTPLPNTPGFETIALGATVDGVQVAWYANIYPVGPLQVGMPGQTLDGHVRAPDTPAGAPDGITPGVDTPVNVYVGPDIPATVPVTLAITGNSDTNGKAWFRMANGGLLSSFPVTTAGVVDETGTNILKPSLYGSVATPSGNAGHLQVSFLLDTDMKNSIVLAASDGFQVAMADATKKISGTIVYKRAGTTGMANPVRFAEVDVYEKGIFGGKVFMTYTDAQGNFSIVYAANDPRYKDLNKDNVKFYVTTVSDKLTNPAKTVNRTVAVAATPALNDENQAQYPFSISFVPSGASTNNNIVGTLDITDQTYAQKAFWVYDAAVAAAQVHATLPGVKDGLIILVYPWFVFGSGTLGATPRIYKNQYDDWDTIIHEYGHAIQQENGFFPFSILDYGLGAPFGHGSGYNLRQEYPGTPRDQVNKLAFSEGWADFYSMLAQRVGYTPPIQIISNDNGAAKSGDGLYWDTTVEIGEPLQAGYVQTPQGRRATRTDPLSTSNPRALANGGSAGEDDENTVMRILWDLYDSAGTGAADYIDSLPTQNMDRVALGYGNLFTLLKDNKVMSLNNLYQALKETATYPNSPVVNALQLINYGAVFELNNVSSRPSAMLVNSAVATTWTAGDPIPEFTFNWPQGNPPLGITQRIYTLNEAKITVFDENYRVLASSPLIFRESAAAPGIINNSWTPSAAQWAVITGTRGVKHWVVEGPDRTVQTRAVPKGMPLKYVTLTGPYVSDESDFTVQ